MMKKIFSFLLILVVFLFIIGFYSSNTFAATINFNETSINTSSNSTFSLQINIDSGEEEIRSADVFISYDQNFIQVDSVSEGSFFPKVTSNKSTAGKVYIVAMVEDPAVTKKGSGTIAIINFKAIKEGTTNISIDCLLSKIVKADIDATNILTCSQTPTTNINIGGSSTSSDTSPQNNSYQPTPPSSLPKTGIFDNLKNVVKPGIILFIFGTVLRILL